MSVIQFITFLMIGLGLSLDSFAVSVSIGLLKPQIHFRQACKVAAPLALFQAAFPVIGWYIGNVIGDIVASIDHWIFGTYWRKHD